MKSTCLGKSGQTTRSTAESRPLPRAEERARPCCLLCLRPRKPERQLWLREALEHVAGLGSHSAAAVISSKSSINLMVAAWPLGSPPKHCSLLPFPSFPSGRSSLCCPSLAALFGCAESRLGGFQDFTPQHRAPKPLPWICHEALKHPYSSCSWVKKNAPGSKKMQKKHLFCNTSASRCSWLHGPTSSYVWGLVQKPIKLLKGALNKQHP